MRRSFLVLFFEVCKRLGNGRLIGIDQDGDAIAAALASMDCLSVQSSVSSVAMKATAPVISPFVRIGAMVRAWVVIPSTALSGSAVVSV